MSPMEIVNEAAYPGAILAELKRSGRIKRQIANRWLLGWPGRVKELIKAGQYLQALEAQYQAELDALADNADPTLAEHEKVELAGLSLECPLPRD